MPQQIIGLQTLAWQLMCRRCQEGYLHPVRRKALVSVVADLRQFHVTGRKCSCCPWSLQIVLQWMGRCHKQRKLAVRASTEHFFSLLPLIRTSSRFVTTSIWLSLNPTRRRTILHIHHDGNSTFYRFHAVSALIFRILYTTHLTNFLLWNVTRLKRKSDAGGADVNQMQLHNHDTNPEPLKA